MSEKDPPRRIQQNPRRRGYHRAWDYNDPQQLGGPKTLENNPYGVDSPIDMENAAQTQQGQKPQSQELDLDAEYAKLQASKSAQKPVQEPTPQAQTQTQEPDLNLDQEYQNYQLTKGAGKGGRIESTESPWSRIGDKFSGLYKSYLDNSALLLDAAILPSDTHSAALRDRIVKNYQNAAAAAPVFGKHLLQFFDAFSKAGVNEVLGKVDKALTPDIDLSTATVPQILGAGAKKIGKGTVGLGMGIGKATIGGAMAEGALDTFLFNPIEVVMGEEFSEDDRQSTPEERAIKGKKLLGDIIMVLATHKVSTGIEKKLIGNEAIGTVEKTIVKEGYQGVADLPSEVTLQASKGPKYGAITRKAVANSIGGAVGGFTGGLVQASGDENALEAALLNGVMAIPMGLAQEFAIGKVKALRGKVLGTPEEVAAIAGSIFDERQLKLYAQDSYDKAIQKLSALAVSDNLSEAAQKLGKERVASFFDKSVARDDHDALKIVYHGPDKGSLEYDMNAVSSPAKFGTGHYVSTKPTEGATASVVNIENPLDMDKMYSGTEVKHILGDLDIPEIREKPYEAMSGQDLYEIMDRHYGTNKNFLKENLADAGYDGIVYTEDGNKNYMAFDEGQVQHVAGLAAEDLAAKVKGTFDIEKFKQNFYDEWNHFAYQTSDIMNAEPRPGFNFDKMLLDFAKSKGIDSEYIPALRDDIVNRMKSEFLDAMEPDERFAYSQLLGELEKAQSRVKDEYVNEGARVARKANEQGMYIDRDPDGSLVLKSRTTGGKILDMKDSEILMNQFAKDAGRPRETTAVIDPSVGIPTEAIPLKPPQKALPRSDNVDSEWSARRTITGKLIDLFNTSRGGSLVTAVKDVITSIDNKHGTDLIRKAYLTTQVASRKSTAILKPFINVLNQINHDYRRFSNEQWRQVAEYREARTAQELVDRFTKTRGVSPIEQSQGQWLKDNDIDITKVFEYDRAWKKLNEERIKGNLTEEAFTKSKETLDKEMTMDARHLEAHARKLVIQEGSRYNSDYGAVVAYARALKSGISKKDYAFKYQLTPHQIRAAERLDGFYDSMAKHFGLDGRRQLEDYMNHYKRYNEYPDLQVGATKSEEFLSLMPRTGEIEAYENHPIIAASRYATAGVKTKELYPVWNKALKDIEEELNKLNDKPKQKAAAAAHLSDYMEGIIGNRQFISDATMEYGVDVLRAREMGIRKSEEELKGIVRKWTSLYFATSESSAQGFRPSQGVRDFYTTWNNHYMRFGLYRANRALALFASMSKQQIHELEQAGTLATLQPYEAVIPGQMTSEMLDWMNLKTKAFYEASFQASLQKQAYRNGHAMVYNETYINAIEQLTKLWEGKISKEKAYNKMSLNGYDPSIAQRFNDIVRKAKSPEEGARFLAQITATENVFAFGAANQPRLMTNMVGAFFGQFGVWPAWESRFIARGMGRGSIKNRMAFGMRYATSQAALAAADGLSGFNLSSWFLTPAALAIRQGPVAQGIYNTLDASSPNERVASLARNSLSNQLGLLVPGNQFRRGAGEAYDLWERGFDPVTYGLRAAGVGVDEQNKNWWDTLIRGGDTEIHTPFPGDNPVISIPHEASLGFAPGRETVPNQFFGIETQEKPKPTRKRKGVEANNQE